MKKVSDFFDLPVGSDTGIIIDSEGRHFGEFNLMVEAEAAAHAINNVDALADALQELLDLACDAGLQNRNSVTIASEALHTYRGTK